MLQYKYIVFPGFVRSKNDGDEHFIGAGRLIRLHGINPRECLIVPHGQDPGIVLAGRDCSDLKVLRPNYHGIYRDE